MSDVAKKIKILAVSKTGQALKKGGEILMVMADPPAPGGNLYKTFNQRFLEMKQGTEVEVTYRESEYQGKAEYIIDLPRSGGSGGGGGGRGRSPEELAYMEKDSQRRHDAMCRSYAKDLLVSMMTTGVFVPKNDAELKTKFDWLVAVVSGQAPSFQGDDDIPPF